MKRLRLVAIPSLFIMLSCLFPSLSPATTDYARQTGKECRACHVEAIGGGLLTKEGEAFMADMKVRGLYRPLSKTQQIVRFLIGYIHLLTAIAWFGTILYVHILLKPAYAAAGLPKGELLLGWFSIIVLAVTGALLTVARVPSVKVLYTTRFGILLSIKIFLFLLMASTAFVVTFIIGPKLRQKMKKRCENEICRGKQDLTVDALHDYDGKEGRPAFIAYRGKIYDATQSKLWKDGSHVKKHLAGHDLTDALRTAPHGEEKVLSLPLVGNLIEDGKTAPKPLPEKVFYTLAYTNLGFVFLITFIIALWRWS